MNSYVPGSGGARASCFFELSPTNAMRKNAEDKARFYLNGDVTPDMSH